MDIVFGQLHLLMLGTELEAVPADTVSFELCIFSYLRASCVHSDRVCRLYSFIINVLLLFECRWSYSLQIVLHVRNTVKKLVKLGVRVLLARSARALHARRARLAREKKLTVLFPYNEFAPTRGFKNVVDLSKICSQLRPLL